MKHSHMYSHLFSQKPNNSLDIQILKYIHLFALRLSQEESNQV